MNLKNWSAAALACASLLAASAQAVQTINFTNVTRGGAPVTGAIFVAPTNIIQFDVTLATNGPTGVTAGLGLCLDYVNTKIGDPLITQVYSNQRSANGGPTPISASCNQAAGTPVPGADTQIIKGWADSASQGWPTDLASPACTNTACPAFPLPIKLYTAAYTIPAAFTGSTQIGLAANSLSAGPPAETFASNSPLTLCAMPTVTVTKTADGAEPATPAVFSVVLSSAVPAACGTANVFPVTLTLGGTATPGVDYAIAGTGVSASGSTVTVNFPADGAATTVAVNANVIDDSLIEGTETVTLTVAAGSGNYGGTGNTASANILDDDSGVSVVVTQNGAEATPPTAATTGLFTFTRTVAVGSLTVNFALTGTATTPADYFVTAGAGAVAATPTSITFAAGSATAVLSVNVVDDVLVEGTETVILTGANGAGYAFTGTNPVTMSIADNDTPPVLSITAKTDAAEPATNGSFTLTRTGNPTTTVPVNVTVTGTATRGTDYTLSTAACAANTPIAGNTFTIAAAATSLTINLCVIDDAIVEGNETVILTLANPTVATDYTTAAPTTQTANIADDDGPVTVTIVATTPNAAEPATNGLFTVSRTGGGAAQLGQPLVINLTVSGTATNGVDYANIPATVTIAANQTTATVPVTVIDDTLFEGSETVILTIGASANYTVGAAASATVTIADNEVGVGVAASTPNTIEGGNLAFTFTCSGNTGSFQINYTFSGSYQPLPANGTNVTLNCATGLVVSVPTIDDAIQNGTRTLVLTITQVSAPGALDPARASATGTVLDNDVPTIIPTMNPIGLLLMGLLLAAAAGLGMRRKA